MTSFGKTASHQAQLQRALGELGEVLPRVFRGSSEFPAAGWYARVDGEAHFLGDHTGLAFVSIAKLAEKAAR
jgi:hypothetical protein